MDLEKPSVTSKMNLQDKNSFDVLRMERPTKYEKAAGQYHRNTAY